MTALTDAITNVLAFGTSTLAWVSGNPILALSLGFPMVAGAIGIVRRIV